MKDFFSVDGKFFSVMSKIADLFLVTMFWLVGCLPLVTIIGSTASMYQTVVKCIRYEQGTVFSEFREAYIKNLRQGIVLTVLFGVVGAALGFVDYQVFIQSSNRSGLFFSLVIGLLILNVAYILNLIWIGPVFSRFLNTLGNILKLNYVIAVRNFVRGILMLLIIGAALFLFLAVKELLLILPSLVLLLHSHLAEPAMRRFMPDQDENNGDGRYCFR